MRIYKVAYTLDFFCDGDLCDTEKESVTVASETMDGAIKKATEHLRKEKDGFRVTKEKGDDGVSMTYQYKNLQFYSCELVAESEI